MPTALRTLRLRSSRAHSDRKPAIEVQQCPLRAEVGEEIGEELARRRKWTWKWRQRWWRRRRRTRRRRRRTRRRRTTVIKSNNPHLAGGESLGFVKSELPTPNNRSHDLTVSRIHPPIVLKDQAACWWKSFSLIASRLADSFLHPALPT